MTYDEPGDRSLDACRADALVELLLGVAVRGGGSAAPGDGEGGAAGPTCWPPRRAGAVVPRSIEGRLVIDLGTLRGEVDNPCLLDGEPVPAQVGRRLARDVAHWRRMVVDPVSGHLLDYGRRTYLPDALRAFVAERDPTCRNPWCDQPARRAELDHAVEFPRGRSDPANTGMLCEDCHRIKTSGGAFITESASDGSLVWVTAWGQRIRVGPRRYLDDGGSSQPAAGDRGPTA